VIKVKSFPGVTPLRYGMLSSAIRL
jgi:hypothetical protein